MRTTTAPCCAAAMAGGAITAAVARTSSTHTTTTAANTTQEQPGLAWCHARTMRQGGQTVMQSAVWPLDSVAEPPSGQHGRLPGLASEPPWVSRLSLTVNEGEEQGIPFVHMEEAFQGRMDALLSSAHSTRKHHRRRCQRSEDGR